VWEIEAKRGCCGEDMKRAHYLYIPYLVSI
jgi:hypothetical protein